VPTNQTTPSHKSLLPPRVTTSLPPPWLGRRCGLRQSSPESTAGSRHLTGTCRGRSSSTQSSRLIWWGSLARYPIPSSVSILSFHLRSLPIRASCCSPDISIDRNDQLARLLWYKYLSGSDFLWTVACWRQCDPCAAGYVILVLLKFILSWIWYDSQERL
jgi:hypothetical protein